MQALTTPPSVLYVTSDCGDGDETLANDSFILSTAAIDESESWIAPENVDCLLVAVSEDKTNRIEAVSTLREAYPSTPLVAFVGDDTQVDGVLAAGATDVIRSTVAETPSSLVHRRVENACGIRLDLEAHERYETILDTAADAIYQLGPKGQIEAVNDAAAELIGVDREELLGKSGAALISDNDAPRVRSHIAGVVGTECDTGSREIELRRADGETVPCEIRFSTWTDDDDTHAGTVAVVRDISEKRERKAELHEQEKLLQAIGDHIYDLIWIADPNDGETRIQFASVAFEDIWHRPREFLQGVGAEAFFKTIHPDDRERIREANRQLESGGTDYEEVYRIMRPDGELRWVHERAFSIQEDGGVTFTLGVTRDITEQKQRERKLERQHDLFTKAQDMADIGAWEYVIDGENRWTEKVYDILGLPQDVEPSLETLEELIQPADWERNITQLKHAVDTLEPFDFETRIETPAGEQRWVRIRGEPQTENGELVRVRGTAQDITVLREREQKLERNRDFLKQTQHLGSVGGWEFDCQTEEIKWTDEMYELFDVEPEFEPDFDPIMQRYHPDERTRVQAAFHRLITTGEPYYVESRVLTSSGEFRWIMSYGEPVYEDGEIVKARGAVRDIHDRKQREQTLETQRNQLARLDRINRIIRDVDTALVGAESREEIEQELCSRLSQFGRYNHALVFRPGGDEPERTACSHSTEMAHPPNNETPEQSLVREALNEERTLTNDAELRVDESPRVSDENTPRVADENTPRVTGEHNSRKIAAIPLRYDGQLYGAITVSASHEDAFDQRELDVLDELGGTVGYAIAALESREREETLTSLYEGTQDLLGAETPHEVADVVVETAASVLDPPGIGIFLFDRQKNLLKPAAATAKLHEFYGEPIVFGPGRPDSVVWQTYVNGEKQSFTDIRESEHLSNPDTAVRSALFLPLGEHGVFVVSTPERIPFDEQKQQLIGLLAATTEAALERVAGREGIKKRDERLEEHTAQLTQFRQLFSVRNDVERLLRRVETREEIEQGVTTRLTKPDTYGFAWVGDCHGHESAVVPRAWANGDRNGSEESYLDAVSLDSESTEPTVRAATTGDPVVITNITDYLHDAPWAREALTRGYQSVCAVPLVHGEVQYGVASVYATTPDAFGDTAVETLAILGASVGRALHTVETVQAVLAEHTVELEVALPEPESFLNAVAQETGERVSYHDVEPTTDGRATVLFSVENVRDDEIQALEQSFVAVETVEDVEHGDETLFRATLTGPTVPTTLLSCGTVPIDVIATGNQTVATLRVPHDQDVRTILDRIRALYPGSELRARRDQRQTDERHAVRAFENDLTERQREVLLLAYESGFFESPRETTGVELGEQLGISQPTVTHHLREGQRRLLAALLNDTLDI